MTPEVLQTNWQLISPLHLRLRSHTDIHRHIYRRRPWYVLRDKASAGYYRFDQQVMDFLQQMDGQRSVGSIWQAMAANKNGRPINQEEVIGLIAQLHSADMLQGDVAVDLDQMVARKARARRQKNFRRLLSPLAIKIPLADPDRLLNRLEPRLGFIFSQGTLIGWSLLVAISGLLALSHWDALIDHGVSRGTDNFNLLLMVLIFPLIKGVHEMGHALATKHWGGEVHEMGVMFLVLMPLPYVDASASSAFVSKWQRIAVSASGIMIESFLAAASLLLWLNIEPGTVRDIAFNVMVIGGLSTVLFNGNPLLRFDGYYLLADLLEIPNLATRSNRYLGYLTKRYLLAVEQVSSPVVAAGERGWFLIYGLASFIYRLYISIVIAFFVAGKFFLLGVILAVWALSAQLLYPLLRHTGYLLFDPSVNRRRRALSTVGTIFLLSGLFVAFVPVASWTYAEGLGCKWQVASGKFQVVSRKS